MKRITVILVIIGCMISCVMPSGSVPAVPALLGALPLLGVTSKGTSTAVRLQNYKNGLSAVVRLYNELKSNDETKVDEGFFKFEQLNGYYQAFEDELNRLTKLVVKVLKSLNLDPEEAYEIGKEGILGFMLF